MPPEALLEKDTDPRADIFSLGVILYEAVSGRHPFLAGSFMATSDRTLHEVPPPLARLNPKFPAELGRMWPRCWPRIRTSATPPRRICWWTCARCSALWRIRLRCPRGMTPLVVREDGSLAIKGRFSLPRWGFCW